MPLWLDSTFVARGGMKDRFAIVAVVLLVVVAGSAATLRNNSSRSNVSGTARDSVTAREHGYLTWEEALARNHPVVTQFRKPEGVTVCPAPEAQKPVSPAAPPPADGPVCFLRPEDQGLLIPEGPSVGGLGPPSGYGS